MCVCENGLKPFSVGRFLVHGCDLWGVWNSLHIFVLKNWAPYMAAQMPIYALHDPSGQSVQFWHLTTIMFLFLDCLSANLLLSALFRIFLHNSADKRHFSHFEQMMQLSYCHFITKTATSIHKDISNLITGCSSSLFQCAKHVLWEPKFMCSRDDTVRQLGEHFMNRM